MSSLKIYQSMEPSITWLKTLCKFCKEPCGSNKPCEKELDENIPVSERLLEINGQFISIFSEDCFYKTKNLWSFNVNFPVSASLIREISLIPGVEGVWPITKYSGGVHISSVFPEKDVQLAVAAKYKTFIKSKQAELSSNENKVTLKPYKFPNDKTVWVDPNTHATLTSYFGA